MFNVPLWRHFLTWLGCVPATSANFKKMLQHGSVAVVVGGIAEMYMQVGLLTGHCLFTHSTSAGVGHDYSQASGSVIHQQKSVSSNSKWRAPSGGWVLCYSSDTQHGLIESNQGGYNNLHVRLHKRRVTQLCPVQH